MNRKEIKPVRALGIASLLALVAGCLVEAGCTTTLQNTGDVGFKYSTEFAFFHRAAKTSGSGEADVARSNTEIPALVEWFLEGPPPEGGEVKPQ